MPRPMRTPTEQELIDLRAACRRPRPRWAITDDPAIHARRAVHRAIREGRLPRLNGTIPCVDCGASADGYDHACYDEPLTVQPVCRSCNWHRGPAIDAPPAAPSKASIDKHPSAARIPR